MTDKAIAALQNENETIDYSIKSISIHGFECEVKRSNFEGSLFSEVNLLGANFLKKSQCVLTFNFSKDEILMEREESS